jgi:hypothetical protein
MIYLTQDGSFQYHYLQACSGKGVTSVGAPLFTQAKHVVASCQSSTKHYESCCYELRQARVSFHNGWQASCSKKTRHLVAKILKAFTPTFSPSATLPTRSKRYHSDHTLFEKHASSTTHEEQASTSFQASMLRFGAL